MKKFLLLALMSLSFISCNTSTTVTDGDYYYPTPYYTCDWVFDTWSGEFIYACFWVYYSEDGMTQELDLAASVADKEELMLEKNAQYYAQKFSLSQESATKVARQLTHLSLLEERTAEDLADFATKLYGIDTTIAVSAAGKAQMGDQSELDALIEQASMNLGASVENTRALIKELHGAALEANGIKL